MSENSEEKKKDPFVIERVEFKKIPRPKSVTLCMIVKNETHIIKELSLIHI